MSIGEADLGATEANAPFVRSADRHPLKMLRYGQMAGLVKLRRGIDLAGGRRLWAECASQGPPRAVLATSSSRSTRRAHQRHSGRPQHGRPLRRRSNVVSPMLTLVDGSRKLGATVKPVAHWNPIYLIK